MESHAHSDLGDLEAQLASKEKEWKELQAARVHQLESALRKAQEECSSLRERYQQMKEDFQFNLALLDERDKELERYDVVTSRALAAEDKRQDEMRQLRLQVTRLEEQRAREAEQWREKLSKSQQSAAQHRLQLEELKLSMAGEVQRQTEECERMKLDMQSRICEVEAELTLQRQELTTSFDNELKQREHQFNMRMDEMRAVVLSHDLKVNSLTKEVEVHSQAHLQAAEALKASQEFCQQIQSQLLHKEQEMRDRSSVKDHRIKELEEELKLMETRLKKEENDHMKMYEDVIQALKDGEAQLVAQRQAHTEQLQKTEKHIIKLQEDMEGQASQARQVQRDQQETIELKNQMIHRHHTEVERLRTSWDEYAAQVSSEMVVKDTEIFALKERETKLRTELERSREEMEGYKQQLSAGLKREQALEQKRVQSELNWQRRCEDLKAELYLANEQLIQDLTRARDQVKAELMEKEQELQGLTVLLRSVKTERDQALQGLTPKVDYLASEEIHRLQEQNSVLRAVVNQMRKDMEGLSQLPLHPQAQPETSPPQPAQHPTTSENTQQANLPPTKSIDMSTKVTPAGYTEALEQEVSLLKAQCRHLKEQLEGTAGQPSTAPAVDRPTRHLQPGGSENIQRQQQALEQGGRCLEKCANTCALEQQSVRVSNRESALISIMEQSALVQKLQEENLRLRQQQQQQTSALISGGLFDKSDRDRLHSRLKQAALCITRLSMEKQQLIKMGNRLRAQIATAGLQESAEPEKESFPKAQEDQHDRLSTLEQLQYQLTTQELQYALRQRDLSAPGQQVPETKCKDSTLKGAANPWTQGHKSPDKPEPLLGPSRSLLSSEESLRSLKELWKKLDQGLSPSTFSEGDLSRHEAADGDGGAGVQMTMQGVSAPIHNLPIADGKQMRNTSTTTSNASKTRRRPGAPGGTSKIRNYNIKD
ncbi:coiled-coil domain-containing protein 57 [Xyrichtys novacula]|nr:coiled-coil domain-containing protein 57 [Xyrichtys novacula]